MRMESFGVQPNNGVNRPPQFSPEEMKVRLGVDEIMGQLNITAVRYEDELSKLKAGGDVDNEWLGNYQANLIDWMNSIRLVEGTLKRGNEEVLEEIERRLYLLSEEAEKKVLH